MRRFECVQKILPSDDLRRLDIQPPFSQSLSVHQTTFGHHQTLSAIEYAKLMYQTLYSRRGLCNIQLLSVFVGRQTVFLP